MNRDAAPGKQRRGESGVRGASQHQTLNRTESERAAASSMQEQAKPMDTDSSPLADAGEEGLGEAMLELDSEDTRGDAESEEEDRGPERRGTGTIGAH